MMRFCLSKKEFDLLHPPDRIASTRPVRAPARVGGQCDFSDGNEPLDVQRDVSLPVVPADHFNEPRPGQMVKRVFKRVHHRGQHWWRLALQKA